jgi:D-ribose pyranase
MKRAGVLNADLAHAIACLGHGDRLLVVDAGFPIPTNAWRIDLAIVRNLPDLRSVLDVIADEMIVEGVTVAGEVATHNAPLDDWLRRRWPTAERSTIPHTDMLSSAAAGAKAIVRTGAFDPWGNVLLHSGVDVVAFFAAPGVVVPDYYAGRMP